MSYIFCISDVYLDNDIEDDDDDDDDYNQSNVSMGQVARQVMGNRIRMHGLSLTMNLGSQREE